MKEDYLTIYAVVPTYIYQTKSLTPEDKLIAERIIYLCKKEGYCWITNRKLAEIYNIKIETVSRHIKKLEGIGLIKCIYNHNDKNTKRIIQLVNNIWDEYTISYKSNSQSDNNQIVKHNNKYNKKENSKDKYVAPVPEWLDKDIEKQEWNLDDPKERAKYEELEEILRSFK